MSSPSDQPHPFENKTMPSNTGVYYKLASSEGDVFWISAESCALSKTLSDLLQNVTMSTDQPPVPLPIVSSDALRHVLSWCEHYETSPPEIVTDAPLPEWDTKFLSELTNEQLFNLIVAANYLDIGALSAVCAKTAAMMLKGRSAIELRTLFGLNKPVEKKPELILAVVDEVDADGDGEVKNGSADVN